MSFHYWHQDEFEITTDPKRMDLDAVHSFLSERSYWARDIPRETFERSIQNSLCFGLLYIDRQVGFGRVISDYATVAYLADVFILPEYRGRGLAKWLTECILSHPELQNLRRWVLVTQNAHRLYRKCGFTTLARPESFMEIHNPGVYTIHNGR
jgi:GNAT superfamily N-acetyltransferase